MNWLAITTTDAIPNGDYKTFKIPNQVQSSDLEIAIFNIDNQFFAIENRCPHQNLPLADGPITDKTITCPFHGAVFSLVTGAIQIQPNSICENLVIFPIKIENNVIKININ